MEQESSNVLIDTDIGDDIDDALALALALRSPEIHVQAVTTAFGDTRSRARLAAHLLKVFGREDVPVAAGVATPLQPRHRPSGVAQAAILDPREALPALTTIPGPELIVKTALACAHQANQPGSSNHPDQLDQPGHAAHPGQLTLLCLGPLTNIATALQLEPRLFMAIKSIVMIGGTSGVPLPEWNVRSDARAAQIVLTSGIPITMIGWNVTTQCRMRERDIERLLHAASPQARLLSKLLEVWQRHRPRWHPSLPYLHDPLTVVALCRPDLMRFEEMTVRVFTRGPLRGFMVARLLDGPLVLAAMSVEAGPARTWIMQRLLV